MEFSYCGFYRWHLVVAGHGDSMVAVHHEVGFPELVELDRRQVFCAVERSVYALPPLPHARLGAAYVRALLEEGQEDLMEDAGVVKVPCDNCGYLALFDAETLGIRGLWAEGREL